MDTLKKVANSLIIVVFLFVLLFAVIGCIMFVVNAMACNKITNWQWGAFAFVFMTSVWIGYFVQEYQGEKKNERRSTD